jgi:hypothetical protein
MANSKTNSLKYGQFAPFFSPKNLLYTTLELPFSPFVSCPQKLSVFKTFLRKVIHSLDVKTFQARPPLPCTASKGKKNHLECTIPDVSSHWNA